MRRHHAHTAVGDRFHDLRRFATPLPVGIGQVRETLGTACIGTVALHAVGQVQAFAHFHGLLVGRDRLQIHCLVLVVQRLDGCIHLGHFSGVLTGRSPAQHPLEVTQARIERQIDQGENHGQNIQPAPPFRHRVVVFLQGFIPNVAGRHSRGELCLALQEQEHPATNHTHQYDHDDVQVPKFAHEIAHLLSFVSAMARRSPAGP